MVKKLRERFSSFAAAEPTAKKLVRGHEFRFYTLSASMLFECRKAVPPILKALAVLFGDNSGDQTRNYKEVTAPVVVPDNVVIEAEVPAPPESAGEAVKAAVPARKRSAQVLMQKSITSDTSAASLDIIKYRDAERDRALTTLTEAITDNETRRLIGRIIIDSLREDYAEYRGGGRKDEKDKAALELYDDEDFDVVFVKDMLSGVAEANAGLFGDSGKEVVAGVKKKMKQVLATNNDATDEKPGDTDDNKGG